MKTDINIFSYNDYLSFMRSVSEDFKVKKTGPQSLGEWAMRLGYKSPRSLGMVLDGRRLPSTDLIDSFSKYLNLKTKEKQYFSELIKLHKKKLKDQPIEENLKTLTKLNPHINEFIEINTATFSYISKWYHFVLKELLRGKKQIREDYKELSKILRNKVSTNEAKDGIENLIKLGFVKRENDQTLSSKDVDLMTTNDIPSEAIKTHHEGMLEMAKKAIREQDASEREFQAFTFKMNPKDLPEAKDYLRDVIKEFNKRFCNQEEQNVYQLNAHIFSHTDNKGLPQ